ncbi:MAG: hypothetical protein U0R64_07110 [Candidatus Nanopelagicales bacterium]
MPIGNYDPDFTWSATSTVGSADVVQVDAVWYARVRGLDPLQSARVTVTTARSGYLPGSADQDGAAQIGGRLDPILGTPTPTADGFTAPVTNYDPDFTWGAAATSGGNATVARRNGRWLLVVTGVAPDTDVDSTVTTTRPNYDTGSATASSRSLKQALTPQFRAVERMRGGFSAELVRYSSRYRWTATTTAGRVSVSDQGVVRVTRLADGASATVTISTTRAGHARGSARVSARAFYPARTPAFTPRVRTTSTISTRVRRFDPAFTWRITSDTGRATIDGAGRIRVVGLRPGQGTSVTVSTRRVGFESGTATFTAFAKVKRPRIPSATTPGAPRITQIVANQTLHTALLRWSPTTTGRAPLLRAQALCVAGTARVTAVGTRSPLTLRGLTAGLRYTCTVTVTNQIGTSPASRPVKFRAR